jgi:hypothetical protein
MAPSQMRITTTKDTPITIAVYAIDTSLSEHERRRTNHRCPLNDGRRHISVLPQTPALRYPSSLLPARARRRSRPAAVQGTRLRRWRLQAHGHAALMHGSQVSALLSAARATGLSNGLGVQKILRLLAKLIQIIFFYRNLEPQPTLGLQL